MTTYKQYKQVVWPVKEVNRAAREIEAVLTHEVTDADTEVIVARGVDWSRFNGNPKMLRNHNPLDDVGAWDPTTLQLTTIDGSPAWVARGKFYPPGVSESADDLYTRLQHGTMGVSIGFLVKEKDRSPIRPDQTGATLRRIEVVEASLVNFPSCPTCMVRQKHCTPSETTYLIDLPDAKDKPSSPLGPTGLEGKPCSGCGTLVDAAHAYCPNCGRRQERKAYDAEELVVRLAGGREAKVADVLRAVKRVNEEQVDAAIGAALTRLTGKID